MNAARVGWRFLRFQGRLARSLWLLVRGRRDGLTAGRRTPGAVGFTYHRPTTPIYLAFAGINAVEIGIAELIVPAGPVQLVLLVLGGWAVLVVMGLWASLITRPYLVADDGVRLRQGAGDEVRLPWTLIASVERRTARDWPMAGFGVGVSVADGRIGFLHQGETHLLITLTGPVAVAAGHGRTQEVTRVHIGCDQPDELLAALRSRLPSGPTRPPARQR